MSGTPHLQVARLDGEAVDGDDPILPHRQVHPGGAGNTLRLDPLEVGEQKPGLGQIELGLDFPSLVAEFRYRHLGLGGSLDGFSGKGDKVEAQVLGPLVLFDSPFDPVTATEGRRGAEVSPPRQRYRNIPQVGATANRHRLVLHLELQFAVVDVQPADDFGDRHVLQPRGSGHLDAIHRKGMFDDEPQFELGAGDAVGLSGDKSDRRGKPKGLVFDQFDGGAHRSFDGKGDVGVLVVNVQAGEDDPALAHRQAAASSAAYRDVELLAIERYRARDVPHLGHGRQVIDRDSFENHVPTKGGDIEGAFLRRLE